MNKIQKYLEYEYIKTVSDIYLFMDTGSIFLLFFGLTPEQYDAFIADLDEINCYIIISPIAWRWLSKMRKNLKKLPNNAQKLIDSFLIRSARTYRVSHTLEIIDNIDASITSEYLNAKYYDEQLFPDDVYCMISNKKLKAKFNHYFGNDSILDITMFVTDAN